MAFATNRPRAAFVAFVISCASFACAGAHDEARGFPDLPSPRTDRDSDFSESFGTSTPEAVGIDPHALVRLARWIQADDTPIFSLLISRRGKLVFELYTSKIDRSQAHYVMSVTKSFLSAAVGIAIGRHLVRDDAESIADALPPDAFPSDADRERLRPITVKDVLGMSALDSPVFPHQKTLEAIDRLKRFNQSQNRLDFALREKTLPVPGESFLYTDATPELAVGLIALSAHETAFDFAKKYLFDPLGFQNEEWMHEDEKGFDYGAVGLRIRPIDMQKLGNLYLHHGRWNGKQIVPEEWVDKSFTPWIASKPNGPPDYGYFWWTARYGSWLTHEANGWKGQRITIVPAEDLVVTMTAYIEPDESGATMTERMVFTKIMNKLIAPAVHDAPLAADPDADRELATLLFDIRNHALKMPANAENRMIPAVAPKEKHHALTP